MLTTLLVIKKDAFEKLMCSETKHVFSIPPDVSFRHQDTGETMLIWNNLTKHNYNISVLLQGLSALSKEDYLFSHEDDDSEDNSGLAGEYYDNHLYSLVTEEPAPGEIVVDEKFVNQQIVNFITQQLSSIVPDLASIETDLMFRCELNNGDDAYMARIPVAPGHSKLITKYKIGENSTWKTITLQCNDDVLDIASAYMLSFIDDGQEGDYLAVH